MSVGLIALLDDVAGLAKIAAASADDVIGRAAKAGAKSAGVVVDDAAVTPRYVVGFSAEREIPIIAKIARGSLRNKLVILLPLALLLAAFAEWAITPLLMIGGAYLAFEGAEKVYEKLFGKHAAHEDAATPDAPMNAAEFEALKVASAVKTDFILSAEIMAIALAAIPDGGLLTRAIVLALVGIGITVGVYGAVALIVKADDVGLALARNNSRGLLGGIARGFGRGLVRGMPMFLKILATVGTAAMVWVGGGIILHGLEEYGLGLPAHLIHAAADTAADLAPVFPGFVGWFVGAVGAGIAGLLIGFMLIPVAEKVVEPLWSRARSLAKSGNAGEPNP